MLDRSSPALSMSNVGSISEQTVGGLISTASHGTGINFPVLSTAVQSLRIVCPLSLEEGGTQVLTCSRTERAELFNASLCGLGLTGIIVEVSLNVDYAFRLRQLVEECPFDDIFGPQTDHPAVEAWVQEGASGSDGLPGRGNKLAAHPKAGLETVNLEERDPSSATNAGPPRKAQQSIGKLVARGHKHISLAPDAILPRAHVEDPSIVYPCPASSQSSAAELDGDDATTRDAQIRLEEIVASSQHVRCLWFPQAKMCTLMRADRTLEPISQPQGLIGRAYSRLMGYHLNQVLLYASRFHPSLPPKVARLVHYLTHPSYPAKAIPSTSTNASATSEQDSIGSANHLQSLEAFSKGSPTSSFSSPYPMTGRVEPLSPSNPYSVLIDTSHRVFNIDCLFPQYTDEWAIPFSHAASAIRTLRDWLTEEEILETGERIHFPIEIRFTDADDIYLSHAQGRRTCYIGLIQFRPFSRNTRYRSLFRKFEGIMRRYAGRPHWAKAHTCGLDELRRLYPSMDDFLRIRKSVDPDGVLLNPYTRRHLIGEIGDEVGPRVFKARM